MTETSDAIVVQTTVDREEHAQRIARRLVELRLAACVQIVGPIVSVYRWQGTIETATEWLCLVKAPRRHYADLERAILAEHPYELPEIVALPIVAGSAQYLRWVMSGGEADLAEGA